MMWEVDNYIYKFKLHVTRNIMVHCSLSQQLFHRYYWLKVYVIPTFGTAYSVVFCPKLGLL